MITELKQVKDLFDKLEFDEIERIFIKDIAGDSQLFLPSVIGLASLKLSKSIASYTKWLTIVTAILAVVGILQVACLIVQL